MRNRASIAILTFSVLMFSVPASFAGDLDDVKATWEATVEAYNAKNLEAFYANVHSEAVAFGPVSPFATESTAVGRPQMEAVFANLESVNVTPINFKFRMFGDTAAGWGHYVASLKPKDGPMATNFGRITVVYAKSGGKWVMVASHNSAIPSGN